MELDFRAGPWGSYAGQTALGLDPDECQLAILRGERWKYVHFAALPPLLFDLRSDPHWLVNVADDPAHRDAALHCARRLLDRRLSMADRTLTGYAISKQGLRQFDA